MALIYDFAIYKGGWHMGTVSVFDVAKYILKKQGNMTTMKLQKLVYYSQAWSLVWDGEPLFDAEFEAWANGPVCPELFSAHKGVFVISESMFKLGDYRNLNRSQKDTIDSTLSFYGEKDGHWLSMLTHEERPWREARKNVQEGDLCNEIITKESMQDYYGGLT